MSPVITALLTQLPTFVRLFESIVAAFKKKNKENVVAEGEASVEKQNFRKRPTLMALIGATMFMLTSLPAMAVTLAWDANTEADLAGYRLYQAMVPGGPYVMVKEFPKAAVSGVQTLTADGLYYYVLTALDTVGNESGHSIEVSYAETSFPPAAPQALRVAP